MRRTVAVLAALAVVLGLHSVSSAQPFGPGAHWVDTVTPGFDYLTPNLVEFGVDLDFDGLPEFDAVFVDSSVATVARSGALDDSVNYPGTRPIDGHFDVIDTELVSMTLTGTGGAAGWTLRVGQDAGVSSAPAHVAPRASYGVVAELPGAPFLAESFFDIFFEIDGTPFGRLHNDDALRIGTIIDRIPPLWGGSQTDYTTEYPGGGPIPLVLFDDTETPVGQLTYLMSGDGGHHMPEPATIGMLALGGMALLRRRTK